MNIFEKREEINKEIDNKARTIWSILNSIAKEKNVELPWFSRGVKFDLNQYVHIDYVDNPDYDPKLPHTPENIKKQTGFHKISKATNVVGFNANEFEDEYEDFGCDSYHFQMPSDIFFGTTENMIEFLTKHIQKSVDLKECNDRRKYLEIFDFDKRTIQNIFAYCMLNNIDIENVSDYSEREQILKATGAMQDDD